MDVDHAHDQPHRWYSTNLVGVPAQVLGSAVFNEHPVPLFIAGVREAHTGLFALLNNCQHLNEAGEVFVHYLDVSFGLRKPGPAEKSRLGPAEQRRWRTSWRKLLQGWGMDANGAAGAVLKGWVESRFGLVPSFHKAVLARFPSPVWLAYLEEKLSSRYHNNNIYQQLDLLYTYAQWALDRKALCESVLPLAGQHLTLWRGSNRCEEQLVLGRLKDRRCMVRLNNLVSFSVSRDEASCFGDWIFQAQVPTCKVLVFPGLLPGQVLAGEQEVLVLGGQCQVEARYA